MSELKTIVVRCKNTVHTSSRRRAGFVFSDQPSKVQVTIEQYEIIKNDDYLIIVDRGEALKQAKEQVKVDPIKEEIEMTKEEIIKKLIEKGLEEGKDFKISMRKDDLVKLL